MLDKIYLCPDERDFLAHHGLESFDKLWNREDALCDLPNSGRSRTGWSGVSRIEANGRVFFLKKQENFFTYSAKFPFRRLLAEREFDNIRLFDSLNIPSTKVVIFGVRKQEDKHQALIMTEALEDYIPLREVEKKWQNGHQADYSKRYSLITSLASLVRQTHDQGLMHNSLYPKHIFISRSLYEKGELLADKANIRYIDLEKARRASFGSTRQLRDLESLHRKSPYWSEEDRRLFILSYLGKSEFDAEARKLVRRVLSIHRKKTPYIPR